MRRREFIQRMATAGLLLPTFLGGLNVRAFAQRAGDLPFMRPHVDGSDRVLVIFRLMGGNDGLNTLVPYHDDRYYEARGRGKNVDVSVPSEKVLQLHDSTTMGLNPALAPLHELYQEEKVAIVQNIGYEGQNLSHFRSSDIWLSGSDSDVVAEAGWFGRYLETIHPEYPSILPDDPFAIELGTVLSTAISGDHGAMGITLNDIAFVPEIPIEGDGNRSQSAMLEEYMRQTMLQTHHFSRSISDGLARQPVTSTGYDHKKLLEHQLSTVARLIASGVRTQLYIVNIESYDFHVFQRTREQTMYSYFATAVRTFQRDLEELGIDDRVLMTTISEFGRRVVAVGDGTDHGGASMLFVMGTPVLGGLVGQDPDIANVDSAGNLNHHYDFRQLYTTILSQWFGASRSDIESSALPRAFTHLPLLRREVSRADYSSSGAATVALASPTPNPATSRATLAYQLIEGGGDAYLVVSTTEGRTIERIALSRSRGGQVIHLDVRSYPPGVYICTVHQSNRSTSQKMVVIRP